ncbi:MAG: hypothetical protein SGJ20_22160 [Planctomycetota bacterium]|nr:hypothetical protein [Planctomycetota bacterium]
MEKKAVKVGVQEGSGAPPYQWTVLILDFAFDEVRRFLNDSQYQHLAMQVKELARENDPTHPLTVDVKKIEDFYEIRDKGGVLGKLNVRIFFGVDGSARSIVVLGGIKKENNGPTPEGTKIAIRRRWRKYTNGDYGIFTRTQ